MRSSHIRPSLRSLQVFEATVRCGSFTAAASELGITQSGVSRQVADLEGILGLALFVRRGARLDVTPAGDRLAVRLTDAFARTWSAVADARRAEEVVTLSMLPSVATRWFAPRLGGFMAENPGIDLRITASRHLVDFASEGIDAAIRYSPLPSTSLEAVKLCDERVFPVCSPEYARDKGLSAPGDLYKATLLHGDLPETWHAWFEAAGCDAPPPEGPHLGDDGAILQAAEEHHGVALGRSLLVADALATGRLVAPFKVSLAASHAYWFVRPKGGPATGAMTAVRSWLLAQTRQPEWT